MNPDVIFGLIMGFMVAWFFEKYYIGRFSVLPNVAGIFFLLSPYWILIPNLVKWWVYIGVGLGIIALVFLLKHRSLPSWMYDLTYPFYSGKTIMGIYLVLVIYKEYFSSLLFNDLYWIFTIIFVVGIWFVGIKYLGNDYPFRRIF